MPLVVELATINRRQTSRDSGRRESAPFKVMNGSFVFLGRSFCFECAQVPSLSRPRVLLSRIQTIAARPKFSDHINSSSFGRAVGTRRFSNGALLAACGLMKRRFACGNHSQKKSDTAMRRRPSSSESKNKQAAPTSLRYLTVLTPAKDDWPLPGPNDLNPARERRAHTARGQAGQREWRGQPRDARKSSSVGWRDRNSHR